MTSAKAPSHASSSTCPWARTLTLLVAAAVTSCTRGAAARSYTAGDSMLPSIAVGRDLAVVEGELARGSVIVFRFGESSGKEYFKRVIGLPGDTITIRGAEVTVNGATVARCRVGPWSYTDSGGALHEGEIWLETLAGARWLVFHDGHEADAVAPRTWSVGPDEVFVLGDNRAHSNDSRLWYGGKGGGLPRSWIVGTVTGVDAVSLPRDAEALRAAFETCMAPTG